MLASEARERESERRWAKSSSAAAAAAAFGFAALQTDVGLEDQRKAKSIAWTPLPSPKNSTDGDAALGETILSKGTDIAFPPPPTGVRGDELWPDVEHSETVTCRSGSGSSSPTRVSMISTRGLDDTNLSGGGTGYLGHEWRVSGKWLLV
eukprot:gene2542-4112_t